MLSSRYWWLAVYVYASAFKIFRVVFNINVVEQKFALGIKIDYVVDVVVCVAVTPCRRALPNDLVLTCVLAEDFIKYHLRVLSDVPVKMDVDRAVFSKKLPQQNDRFVEPLQVRIESTTPCVPISLLFKNRRLL